MAFNYPVGSANKPAHKTPKANPESEAGQAMEGAGDPSAIHAHLQEQHAQTGNAHTHIEHHADGRHTSHHVDKSGQVSGPHDHDNLEALKSSFDHFVGEEEHEPSEGGY